MQKLIVDTNIIFLVCTHQYKSSPTVAIPNRIGKERDLQEADLKNHKEH